MKIDILRTLSLLIIILFLVASSDASDKKFKVVPDNNLAGSVSDYTILHNIKINKLKKILKGKLVLKTPDSFGLESIKSLELEISDSTIVYIISGFEILDNELHIYFNNDKNCDDCPHDDDDDDGEGDDDDDHGENGNRVELSLNISSIRNPLEGGIYSFLMSGYNEDGKRKFGPIHSKAFLIEASAN